MPYQLVANNTFFIPASPIVFAMGEYQTKVSGYKCITQLSPHSFIIQPQTKTNITQINNSTLQCNTLGNFSVLGYVVGGDKPILYSFRIYETPLILGKEALLSIINQELPAIYKHTNVLNNMDNNGIAAVLASVYEEVYNAFYSAIMSVGTAHGYNPNWEFVYLGLNNFLQNAIYPAAFIQTLIRVPTLTSIQIPPMAQLISRLAFQFTGLNTPVAIIYDSDSKIYNINIYTQNAEGWSLGIPTRTELGDTTYLISGSSSPFLYIISLIIGRLMPVQVKYIINVFSYTADFLTLFNVDDVESPDFIDPSVTYDAYEVVNNNNQFNTKGYFYHPTYWMLGISELGVDTRLAP